MISTTLVSALFLAQAAFGPNHELRTVVVPTVCDVCGVRIAAIDATIARLKSSPRPHDREDASEDLSRFRWTCHPEIVQALSDALLFDPRGGVREEAAESLARLGACEPEAHLALQRAATSDRDGGVRHKARNALRSLPSRCLADCLVCGPLPVATKRVLPTVEVIVPGSVRIINPNLPTPFDSIEPMTTLPPDELPPPPPTPVASSSRSSRINPPPLPADPSVRRSSAKPVIPPTDLPPLEEPTR